MANAESLLHFISNGPEATSKQINMEDLLQKFEFDQWKGLDYTYDLEPQSQNLFYAGYFCEAGDGTDEQSMKMFYNAAYRIKKVSIPFPSMTIEYHPETRAPLVKEVSYTNEISIDWFEDVYHSVQKYHLDWFNRWYSREYDCFRCGIQGKFRKMAVIAFHYTNAETETIIPVPKIEPLFAFIIGGLIPKTIPAMVFDYSSDQNDSLIQMSYNCGPIRWVFSEKVGIGSDPDTKKVDNLFNNSASKSFESVVIGSPISSFDTENTSHEDLERLRITRASTYFQAAEGSI
jgi:hypothetical protein